MTLGRKLAAVILSTTIALLAVEVLLRNFFPRRTAEVLMDFYPAMFKDSDVLPYRLRENYQGRLATTEFDTRIRINSLGYRGKEFTRDKGGALRILTIGDSFTFGWGVNDDETYAAHIERLLAERLPGRQVEVINGGFAACYSPDTYYLYLKNEGLALQPDAIVVGVFVGNDLDSPAAFENEWIETDEDGLPSRIRNVNSHVVGNRLLPRNVPVRYRTPLLSRLHVYQGLFDIWWELAPRLKAWLPGVAITVYAAQPATSSEEGVPYIYRQTYEDRTERVFKRVFSVFAGMHRLATSAGIPLYFAIIPAHVQLVPTAYQDVPVDIGKPQRLLGEFFDSQGIKWVDLRPWFQQRAQGRDVYFPLDGHWNAVGHQLAAERIADFIWHDWQRR